MKQMTIRCVIYERKKEGCWVAQSLEFGLAAQASDPEEAANKLFAQIDDYVFEAMREPEYCNDLLSRKAPLTVHARYLVATAAAKFRHTAKSTFGSLRQVQRQIQMNEGHCA